MKTIIRLAIIATACIAVCGAISAQNVEPLKPLDEFGGDTLKFLKYNVGWERTYKFEGWTIDELCNYLKLDFKHMSVDFSYDPSNLLYHNKLMSIAMFPQPFDWSYKERYVGVAIDLVEPITEANPIHKHFKSVSYEHFAIDSVNYPLVKDLKIKSTSAIILTIGLFDN